MNRAVFFLLLYTICYSEAIPPYPPQIPSYPPQRPILPSQGYFLISWSSAGPAGVGSKTLEPNKVPLNGRANIIKFKNRTSMSGDSVALSTSGRVYVWNNMPYAFEKPVPDDAKENIVDIFFSENWIYAIKSNGRLLVWNSMSNSIVTLPSVVNSGVVTISPGNGGGFLALKENGQVVFIDKSGVQVPIEGPPGMPPTTIMQEAWVQRPVPDELSSGVAQIWAETSLTAGPLLALKNDGSLICWSCTADTISYFSLPQEVSTGVAKIIKHGLVLMRNGKANFWRAETDGSFFVHSFRNSEADLVDIQGDPQSLWNGIYGLTKDGAVLGWDSSFNSLSLNSELSSGVKEILNQNGLNFALKNSGRLLKWSSPPSNLDLSLPNEVNSDVVSLSSLGGDGSFVLSSSPDIAVATYCGLPLGVLAQLVAEKIKNQPLNYGIATKDDVGGAVTQGVQQVLSAPSNYNLYTSHQIQTERLVGQSDVITSPNIYNLYTTNQIKNLGLGGIVIERNSNNQLVLNYQILQSNDLKIWNPYEENEIVITNSPSDKMFLRVQAIDK